MANVVQTVLQKHGKDNFYHVHFVNGDKLTGSLAPVSDHLSDIYTLTTRQDTTYFAPDKVVNIRFSHPLNAQLSSQND